MAAPLPSPVLEVYYSPTCAPCRLELPVLAEFVKADGARLRIVILDDEKRARSDLRDASSALEEAAVAPRQAKPRAALLAARDTDGILPFARALASDGRVCASWRGGLTMLRAKALISACRLIGSRSRRS
ncbi:MAG TPA: thioredoxin family protein [Rhizomicrobium sp.]|nr:thioredoxin family protein [Rhizomicrobium sp.]